MPHHDAHRNAQKGSTWWGTFEFDAPAFDWGPGYTRPNTPLSQLVIYEMSVRCFTADESSGVAPERRGTYLGVADKVLCLRCAGWLAGWLAGSHVH